MRSFIFILLIFLFCQSCKTTYENFNKKSDNKQYQFIQNNLSELNGSELWNFFISTTK